MILTKKSRSMVLIILFTFIITVGKIILKYHFKVLHFRKPKREVILRHELFASEICNTVFFLFFLIQFNVPFKIISLIETSQSIGGAKREYPGKTT